MDRKLSWSTLDRLCVNLGVEISKIVPGYVSTEVDARLSYDVDGSVRRARRIIDMYGCWWQGSCSHQTCDHVGGYSSCQVFEKGRYSFQHDASVFAQAVAAAEAGVRLISPFVGRI